MYRQKRPEETGILEPWRIRNLTNMFISSEIQNMGMLQPFFLHGLKHTVFCKYFKISMLRKNTMRQGTRLIRQIASARFPGGSCSMNRSGGNMSGTSSRSLTVRAILM